MKYLTSRYYSCVRAVNDVLLPGQDTRSRIPAIGGKKGHGDGSKAQRVLVKR